MQRRDSGDTGQQMANMELTDRTKSVRPQGEVMEEDIQRIGVTEEDA